MPGENLVDTNLYLYFVYIKFFKAGNPFGFIFTQLVQNAGRKRQAQNMFQAPGVKILCREND